MHDVLIISGTSRLDGNTSHSVAAFANNIDAHVIELSELNMSPYDYAHENKDDDFQDLINFMLNSEHIVFATPVYWYAMSSQMKIFFDRLSDLITVHKESGRALAHKKTYLIVSGTDKVLPVGFEVPFQRTSEYFDMTYCGACYLFVQNEKICQNSLIDLEQFKKQWFEI